MKQHSNHFKYFLYARKSTESEDRQVASIDSQIDHMKKDAEREELKMIEILSEARSAKVPGRPVFNEMIQRIRRGEAQGIICWKLDRLARNPVDAGQISWMLQQGLIQHIRTHERDYYPSDNVLMMSVEFGMANQYVRDLSVSVKRGMRDKAKRVWWLNPESQQHWDTGDSVMSAYAEHCDAVHECRNLRQLAGFIERLA